MKLQFEELGGPSTSPLVSFVHADMVYFLTCFLCTRAEGTVHRPQLSPDLNYRQECMPKSCPTTATSSAS